MKAYGFSVDWGLSLGTSYGVVLAESEVEAIEIVSETFTEHGPEVGIHEVADLLNDRYEGLAFLCTGD